MTATETISQITSITTNHHHHQSSSESVGLHHITRKLKLLSPVGAESAEYEWPLAVSVIFNNL